MDLNKLEQRLLRLERAFNEHEHTGLDSKTIQTTLEEQSALTAASTDTVDGTYGAEEQAVIENNRTRISEIEDALSQIGVLP